MNNNEHTNQLINKDEDEKYETIKIYFPEIDDVTKYNIKWECLLFFRQTLKKLHNQKVTFGELSLARIKIIELEHIETKETKSLYFNLINVFLNMNNKDNEEYMNYDSAAIIWENCKINYTIVKKLSEFYEYNETTQKYVQNTEVFSIFKTKKKMPTSKNKDTIDFSDEKYDKYQDDFKEIETKINGLIKYEDTTLDMQQKADELQEGVTLFKQSAQKQSIFSNCIREDYYYNIHYIFCFVWLKDFIMWIIRYVWLTERNPCFEDGEDNACILLLETEFTKDSEERLVKDLTQFVFEKFEILGETTFVYNEVYNRCKKIINRVINYVEKGINVDDWNEQFIHPRMQTIDENDIIPVLDPARAFPYFNNNGLRAIKDEIDYFVKEYLNDKGMEIRLPDMYILAGFKIYPSVYEKEYYSMFNMQTSDCLDNAQDLLKINIWYPFFAIVCFISQIIGPIYYIVNYFLFSDNEFCPNRSEISTKIFATCYYLLLYAQFSKMCQEITYTCYQYDLVEITKNKYYIFASWFINNLCLFIIPFFTYTLFIEHNELTDLILNCLTGQFLIEIDNLAVAFSSGDNFLNPFVKDKMLLEYLDKGVNERNIMAENSMLRTAFSILEIIHAYITILVSITVVTCI